MKTLKGLVVLCFIVLFNAALPAQSAPAAGWRNVDLQYVNDVSVAGLSVGKKVELRLLQALKDGDTVLLPKGASAWATVTALTNTQAERSVTLHFEDLELSDGRHAPVWVVPGSHSLRYASRAQGVSVVAFAGHDVFVRIPWPLPQAETLGHPAATEGRKEPASPDLTAYVTPVEFDSTPAGADIEVDGAFVGNTPSTLNLTLGDHAVTVTKPGFVAWTRKVHITAGKVRIVAELEKR